MSHFRQLLTALLLLPTSLRAEEMSVEAVYTYALSVARTVGQQEAVIAETMGRRFGTEMLVILPDQVQPSSADPNWRQITGSSGEPNWMMLDCRPFSPDNTGMRPYPLNPIPANAIAAMTCTLFLPAPDEATQAMADSFLREEYPDMELDKGPGGLRHTTPTVTRVAIDDDVELVDLRLRLNSGPPFRGLPFWAVDLTAAKLPSLS